MKRQLSQREIDAVFQGDHRGEPDPAGIVAFDFSRLDRIPKSQLRAIHMLHEDFVRSLSSNLSAYLRSFVGINLVSLEQISYAEYVEGLATPSCIAYVNMPPYDGTAVMEVTPSIVFAIVELMLGGTGEEPVNIQRKITDIEKGLMQSVLRIVLNELQEAWRNVADIRFAVQMLASEPQLMRVLAPTEAVVVITTELRIGPSTGTLSFAIPSIFIKRLRHKFDQLQQVRKAAPTQDDQAQVAKLLPGASLRFEARLENARLSTGEFLSLQAGDILMLGQPLSQPIVGILNGQPVFTGTIRSDNDRLMLQVQEVAANQES